MAYEQVGICGTSVLRVYTACASGVLGRVPLLTVMYHRSDAYVHVRTHFVPVGGYVLLLLYVDYSTLYLWPVGMIYHEHQAFNTPRHLYTGCDCTFSSIAARYSRLCEAARRTKTNTSTYKYGGRGPNKVELT